jgi:molybdopterin-guanine dinucleotide biosynthesis protein A
MIGGIILCGGLSRRMGRSKVWLPFGPEVMLQRVVRILSEVVGPIVVVAALDQDLPRLAGSVVIVRDPIVNRGPLQGLATGLKALSLECELAYVTATDSPFLAPSWVTRLAELIGEADLAIPDVDGRLHPLAAIYRCSTALAASECLLAEGRSRLLDVLERLRTIRVDTLDLAEVDPTLATLRNLNTWEDYELALIDSERNFRNPIP